MNGEVKRFSPNEGGRHGMHDDPHGSWVCLADYAEMNEWWAARENLLLTALSLIAAPRRPDGSWNRDREACRALADAAINNKPLPDHTEAG